MENKIPRLEQKQSAKGSIMYVSPASLNEAQKKKPTVVFIHNMWGNHKVTLRHVRLMNRLGYDTVTLDVYKSTSVKQTLTVDIKKPFSFLYKAIVEQVEDVLDSIEGEKIIFGFSGPSLCGFIAASPRTDVVAYICDGGPFKELWECTYRMFTLQTAIPTRPLRMVATTLAYLYWGTPAFCHFQEALSNWPKSRPILSLRGASDPIVFPQNIDNAFNKHPELPLTVAVLKAVGHLDGLKLKPDEYEKSVRDFLEKI